MSIESELRNSDLGCFNVGLRKLSKKELVSDSKVPFDKALK